MPKLTSLRVDLTGNAKGLIRATEKAKGAVVSLGKGVVRVSKGVAALGGIGAAGIGVAAAALGGFTRATLNQVDGQAKLAKNLQTSVQHVQELSLQADLSGMDMQSLSQAMLRTARLAGDVLAGKNKTAEESFARIGITVAQLRKLDPPTLFHVVARSLGEMQSEAAQATNATERVAKQLEFASVASSLFEEQWRRLAPLFESYTETAKVARSIFGFEEGQLKLGLSDAEAKQVEGVITQFTTLSHVLTALRNRVIVAFTPELRGMADALMNIAAQWIQVNGGGLQLAHTLKEGILENVDGIVAAVDKWRTGFEFIIGLGRAIVAVLEKIGEGIGAASAVVGQLIEGNVAGAGAIALDALGGNDVGAFSPDAVLDRLRLERDKESGRELSELEQQTRLLGDIAANQLNQAAVFR